jgi:hypothetical protein
MTALSPILNPVQDLPSLIHRAANMLAGTKTAAEVLEAREIAGVAYDAAKRAARLSRAKAAHDDLVAAAHRAQAHALEIEAAAKRLADEYDGAQARRDVGQQGARTDLVHAVNEVVSSAADLGLNRREIHEARQLRDAEANDPGIVRRTLNDRLERGEDARRFMRRKGLECLAEADRLDALFAAIATGSAEAPPFISHAAMQQSEGVH